MGMMKRLYQELEELGYTHEEIDNQKYLADGWTLEKLHRRYVKSVKRIRDRINTSKRREHQTHS